MICHQKLPQLNTEPPSRPHTEGLNNQPFASCDAKRGKIMVTDCYTSRLLHMSPSLTTACGIPPVQQNSHAHIVNKGSSHNADVEEIVAGKPQIKSSRLPPLWHAQCIDCGSQLRSMYAAGGQETGGPHIDVAQLLTKQCKKDVLAHKSASPGRRLPCTCRAGSTSALLGVPRAATTRAWPGRCPTDLDRRTVTPERP